MKRISFLFLIIVWGLTFVTPSLLSAKVADTRDIELRAKTDNGNELRSLLPVRAWLDNRVVCVSFLGSPEEVTVSISDTEGMLVDTYHYQSPQTVSIPITEGIGMFRIEIECDSNIFNGEFELK